MVEGGLVERCVEHRGEEERKAGNSMETVPRVRPNLSWRFWDVSLNKS